MQKGPEFMGLGRQPISSPRLQILGDKKFTHLPGRAMNADSNLLEKWGQSGQEALMLCRPRGWMPQLFLLLWEPWCPSRLGLCEREAWWFAEEFTCPISHHFRTNCFGRKES